MQQYHVTYVRMYNLCENLFLCVVHSWCIYWWLKQNIIIYSGYGYFHKNCNTCATRSLIDMLECTVLCSTCTKTIFCTVGFLKLLQRSVLSGVFGPLLLSNLPSPPLSPYLIACCTYRVTKPLALNCMWSTYMYTALKIKPELLLIMYTCTCMYVCMCMCDNVYMYMLVCTLGSSAPVYVHVHVRVHVRMFSMLV